MSTIQEMKAINDDNSSDNQEAAPFCRLVPRDITARPNCRAPMAETLQKIWAGREATPQPVLA